MDWVYVDINGKNLGLNKIRGGFSHFWEARPTFIKNVYIFCDSLNTTQGWLKMFHVSTFCKF
jgi:hypothetical protein